MAEVTTDPDVITCPEIDPGNPDLDIHSACKDAFAPRHALLLWNDDHSPMELVVEALVRILAHPVQKAVTHMLEAHSKGKTAVAWDTLEKLELFHEQFGTIGLTTSIESLD